MKGFHKGYQVDLCRLTLVTWKLWQSYTGLFCNAWCDGIRKDEGVHMRHEVLNVTCMVDIYRKHLKIIEDLCCGFSVRIKGYAPTIFTTCRGFYEVRPKMSIKRLLKESEYCKYLHPLNWWNDVGMPWRLKIGKREFWELVTCMDRSSPRYGVTLVYLPIIAKLGWLLHHAKGLWICASLNMRRYMIAMYGAIKTL